jgi:hypothetical protein
MRTMIRPPDGGSIKRAGACAAILLTAALIACGGATMSSPTRTTKATGAFSETLSNSTNQQLGSFSFNMTQSDTALNGSGMNFANMGSLAQCFGAGTVMSGQTGPGMMNGGTLTMTMSFMPSGSTETNTMTMEGTMAMGMDSGSGTFTLTGQTPGCTSQTGTFSMTQTSKTSMM